MLGIQDRISPVLLPADDQRGRHDLLHLVEGRDLVPKLAVLPGQSQFQLPLELPLVMAVVGHIEHFAGPRDGGLESIGLGDHVIRHDPAVGPASHAHPVRVGVALLDGIVDGGHFIFEVLDAPGLPDLHGELLAVTGRPSRVGAQHQVAFGSEELRFKVPAEILLRDRSPMGPKQRGIGEALVEIGREGDEGFDFGAVAAFKPDLLDSSQLDPGKKLVVGVSQPAQLSLLEQEHFGGQVDLAVEEGDGTLRTQLERPDAALAGHGPADAPRGKLDPGQVLLAAVLQQKIDGLAVGRKAGRGDVAVQFLREQPGFTSPPRTE